QNNDIIASAAQGNGGNIELFTNAIFGIEERGSTPINNTNDLDASSNFGLDGTVNINELDVNPTEGLEELPVEIIDVAGLVEQNLCQQGQGSEFIVTGKGGIAPSPNQAREGEMSEVDLVEPTSLGADEGSSSSVQNASIEKKAEIVEAQGWIVNDRGIVELVAHKSNNSPSQPKGNNVCSTINN
ncbi:MAG: filamentous hemagglutinin N-terminal domain-containing protein, partial [Waterburya sp.]